VAARVSEAQFGRAAEARRRGSRTARVAAVWTLRGVCVEGESVHTDADVALEATLELSIERVGEDRVVAMAHVEGEGGRVRVACVEAEIGEGAGWERDETLAMTHVDVAGLARLSAASDGAPGYGWTALIERLGVRGGRSRLRGVVATAGE